MPISRRFDAADEILFMEFSGTVTMPELQESWREALTLSATGCRRHLADLREVADSAFTGSDLHTAVLGLLSPSPIPSSHSTAIVAHNGAQYGVARMFSAFADGLFDVQVFTDVDAALAWLRARPAAPAGRA
jgi:hypothetical protein